MTYRRNFVPVRLAAAAFLIGGAWLAGGYSAAFSANQNHADFLVMSGEDTRIDPIMTGGPVTQEMLAQWEARKAAYKKCAGCDLSQPYPGDLED